MARRPAAASQKTRSRPAHRLDITVWQFVRIMVQLEAVAKSRGGRRRATVPAAAQQRPVYGDWKAAWQEVDRELTRLGESDADAFADLMMNQNVVLEVRGRSQLNEVTRAIDNIVHQMREQVRASTGDEEHVSDLRFEIRELEKLAKKLSGLGRKKPAPAKPAATKPAATKPAGAKPAASKPATPDKAAAPTREDSGSPRSARSRATGAPGRPPRRRSGR